MAKTPPPPKPPVVPIATQVVEKSSNWNIWSSVPGIYKAVRLPGLARGDCYFIDANTAVLEDALGAAFPIGTALTAETLASAYDASAAVATAKSLLNQVFGDSSKVESEIESDPDSGSPTLVLRLMIDKSKRHLRETFLEKYSAMEIPDGAPIPALMWEYQSGDTA